MISQIFELKKSRKDIVSRWPKLPAGPLITGYNWGELTHISRVLLAQLPIYNGIYTLED